MLLPEDTRSTEVVDPCSKGIQNANLEGFSPSARGEARLRTRNERVIHDAFVLYEYVMR